ncbi:hypothetical protein GMRT_13319 [Giardia muris]|uniref:Uncharacterized protein n=1 Tax=Giardia muris TaxID=5742 RepID=A0A4Z1SKX3_GIAMU|nr:hypothetical protein GMRT_13319 [Giardia muris]|eukprot:TNJ26282.1 hypothetical protein GMRT_13319 [Giardia muris]
MNPTADPHGGPLNPKPDDLLQIYRGHHPSLHGQLRKQHNGMPVVNLGHRDQGGSAEEKEEHLLRALCSTEHSRESNIPAPKLNTNQRFGRRGFVPGSTYEMRETGARWANIIRDLDDRDLAFHDQVMESISTTSENKPFPTLTEEDGVRYDEEVLEWLLVTLDAMYSYRARNLQETAQNTRAAFDACKLVVNDASLFDGTPHPLPDVLKNPTPEPYLTVMQAECSGDPAILGTIVDRIPFITYSLFELIFKHFVERRKALGTPLIPCLRERPYKGWNSGKPKEEQLFLVFDNSKDPRDKRLSGSSVKSLQSAHTQLYLFNALAEFVCLREAVELSVLKENFQQRIAKLEDRPSKSPRNGCTLTPMSIPPNSCVIDAFTKSDLVNAHRIFDVKKVAAPARQGAGVLSSSPRVDDFFFQLGFACADTGCQEEDAARNALFARLTQVL